MLRRNFTADWTFAPKVQVFASMHGGPAPQPVAVPHDAIRDLPRSAQSPQGEHTGYYPGGIFTYTKSLDAPKEWEGNTVLLDFEAVYRDAVVRVNGNLAAQRPNGYAGFIADIAPYLKYSSANTITVEARADRDSRWYSGAGLIRPVHLVTAGPLHIALDGVRITTPQVAEALSVAEVATIVQNHSLSTRTVRVRTEVTDAAGLIVAQAESPVTLLPGTDATDRKRLPITDPHLWNVDAPHLYSVRTVLVDDGRVIDEEASVFGIRRVELDPVNGLRINGEAVKLRGACVHHDNGPLGAVSVPEAEDRRVRLLKEAGFNAIRSAHNPVARATLDACDRQGVLVMDELTDVWTQSKTDYDYSINFPEWWERDLESMVTKDFNHPSVIMYSIGNEIFEVGSSIGSTWGRRLVEAIRRLDPTRFVTNAINPMIAVIDQIGAYMEASAAAGESTDINTLMGTMEDFQRQIAAANFVTDATEEAVAMLDVAGFNYGDSRYSLDAERFPHRILVGSETFGPAIDELWKAVLAYPTVIGDFTWTGWDYLGEAGIGRIQYIDDDPEAPRGIGAGYPYLLAVCGDIDITGHRKPLSYYRETVYGLRTAPYIAVHRPQRYGQEVSALPWSWTDSVSSWSWDVESGAPVVVDVYTDADEVELFVNEKSLGVQKVGMERAFQARFDTNFEPGRLVAVARTTGREEASTELRTAGAARTAALQPDQRVGENDEYVYVHILLVDEDGIPVVDADRRVTVSAEGQGVLAGLGTGRSATEEAFGADECTTYDGRALAIIRRTGSGRAVVAVQAEGILPAQTEIIFK